MTPTQTPRAVGQQGVRVVTDWESDIRRRMSAQECEVSTLRSEVAKLKERLSALERLVTNTGGGECKP